MSSRLWRQRFCTRSAPLPESTSLPQQATLAACIAASSKAIRGLKEVFASKDDDCAICLTASAVRYKEDGAGSAEPTTSTLRAMPCLHVFHQRCIFEWLGHNSVCPLCRHQLPTVDDEKEEEKED